MERRETGRVRIDREGKEMEKESGRDGEKGGRVLFRGCGVGGRGKNKNGEEGDWESKGGGD